MSKIPIGSLIREGCKYNTNMAKVPKNRAYISNDIYDFVSRSYISPEPHKPKITVEMRYYELKCFAFVTYSTSLPSPMKFVEVHVKKVDSKCACAKYTLWLLTGTTVLFLLAGDLNSVYKRTVRALKGDCAPSSLLHCFAPPKELY